MVRQQELSDSFLAVNDVSFTVEQGESIGLMGLNGSGKSTLLKMINGVMRPDAGKVLTRGPDRRPDRHRRRLPPPADRPRERLPQRRHPRHDRGRDHAQVRRHRRVRRHRPASSTPRSATTPRACSPGSASPIAIHVDADIFLADEVLAVGDRPFKRKCMAKMQEIRDSGTTLFYVSHAAGSGPQDVRPRAGAREGHGSPSTATSTRASSSSTTTTTTSENPSRPRKRSTRRWARTSSSAFGGSRCVPGVAGRPATGELRRWRLRVGRAAIFFGSTSYAAAALAHRSHGPESPCAFVTSVR